MTPLYLLFAHALRIKGTPSHHSLDVLVVVVSDRNLFIALCTITHPHSDIIWITNLYIGNYP